MDYSDRVNSKKGAGGVADQNEANVHRKKRVRDLLTNQLLNLDNDPYVFKNHLGILECRLCLTTHVNESSYISHIGGKKHQLNLERRRLLDEKNNKPQVTNSDNILSINTAPKKTWNKIGKPEFNVSKIRDVSNYKVGLLINVKYPQATYEPLFVIENYYELSMKNQNITVSYLDTMSPNTDAEDIQPNDHQYLIISCEPYENICIIIPNREIDKSNDNSMSETFWWYWDSDVKEYYIQFLYKDV